MDKFIVEPLKCNNREKEGYDNEHGWKLLMYVSALIIPIDQSDIDYQNFYYPERLTILV